jgi:hypothetical protein
MIKYRRGQTREEVRNKEAGNNRTRYNQNTKIWVVWLKEHKYSLPTPNFHYHHEEPKTKLFNIGTFIRNHKWSLKNEALLIAELNKTTPLTRDEHIRLHRKEMI